MLAEAEAKFRKVVELAGADALSKGITSFHDAGSSFATIDGFKRIANEVAAIVRLDDVKERLDSMGTIPVGGTPAEFELFLTSETTKWGKVIREAKITAD